MNLLISSKVSVLPQRLVIDFLPERAKRVRITALVFQGDALLVKDAPQANPPAWSGSLLIDRSGPPRRRHRCTSTTGLRKVDVATPYGTRRDYRLDGETLYSRYVA